MIYPQRIQWNGFSSGHPAAGATSAQRVPRPAPVPAPPASAATRHAAP